MKNGDPVESRSQGAKRAFPWRRSAKYLQKDVRKDFQAPFWGDIIGATGRFVFKTAPRDDPGYVAHWRPGRESIVFALFSRPVETSRTARIVILMLQNQ